MDGFLSTLILPAVWVVVVAINGPIAAGEADVVESGDGQPAVYADVDEILLLPSLQEGGRPGHHSQGEAPPKKRKKGDEAGEESPP